MSATISPPSTSVPRRMLRLRQVREKTSLSTGYIYELIKSGEFPRQVVLAGKRVAWDEREIDDWIEARVRASRGGAAW